MLNTIFGNISNLNGILLQIFVSGIGIIVIYIYAKTH